SIDNADLPAGIYTGTLPVGALGATSAVANVTLIVNPAGRVRPAPWKDGRRGAMSVAIDDSLPTAYDKLKTNGVAGTYYGMGYAMPSFYTTYYLNGMELGSHPIDHSCYGVLTEPMISHPV